MMEEYCLPIKQLSLPNISFVKYFKNNKEFLTRLQNNAVYIYSYGKLTNLEPSNIIGRYTTFKIVENRLCVIFHLLDTYGSNHIKLLLNTYKDMAFLHPIGIYDSKTGSVDCVLGFKVCFSHSPCPTNKGVDA